jgi:hypothetical protein
VIRLLLCTSLAMLVVSACQAARDARLESFLLSAWWPPRAADTTDGRYAEIAEANFNIVMGPEPQVTKQALQLSAAHKLKTYIWDSRIDAALTAEPLDEDAVKAVAREYKNDPALAGYYITDEPNASLFPRLAKIVDILRAEDPRHPAFVNLFPNYASREQLGSVTYRSHVEDFVTRVRPDVLSFDHYALMQDGTVRGGYFENLAVIADIARKYKIPFVDIILLTPHFDYRDPSAADLHWQAYTAAAFGAKGILYFTYWTPQDEANTFRNGIIGKDGKRTRHYEEVKSLNAELKALGPQFMDLEWLRTYYVGEDRPPAGLERLWTDSLVQEVTSPILVGEFKDVQGNSYILIVNMDMKTEKELTIRLLGTSVAAFEIGKTDGKAEAAVLRGGPTGRTLECRLAAGDGRLYRLSTVPDITTYFSR